jgi:hypothetical protein
MSTAELNKKKLDLIAWINQLSDVNLISFLEGLRNSRTKNDWWSELSDHQKKIVLKGLKDAEKGKVISSNKFWKNLKDA